MASPQPNVNLELIALIVATTSLLFSIAFSVLTLWRDYFSSFEPKLTLSKDFYIIKPKDSRRFRLALKVTAFNTGAKPGLIEDVVIKFMAKGINQNFYPMAIYDSFAEFINSSEGGSNFVGEVFGGIFLGRVAGKEPVIEFSTGTSFWDDIQPGLYNISLWASVYPKTQLLPMGNSFNWFFSENAFKSLPGSEGERNVFRFISLDKAIYYKDFGAEDNTFVFTQL